MPFVHDLDVAIQQYFEYLMQQMEKGFPITERQEHQNLQIKDQMLKPGIKFPKDQTGWDKDFKPHVDVDLDSLFSKALVDQPHHDKR